MRADARALVYHFLLQEVSDEYILHDMVHKYLQDAIVKNSTLLATATARQAQYLAKPEVLLRHALGQEPGRGGMYALLAMWNAVTQLDNQVDIRECYMESLKGVTGERAWYEAGNLMRLLVRHIF